MQILLVQGVLVVVIVRPGRIQRSSHERFPARWSRYNFRQSFETVHRRGDFRSAAFGRILGKVWNSHLSPRSGRRRRRSESSDDETAFSKISRPNHWQMEGFFAVESVLAPASAVFGVPISWYSVPWSPFICRLKCESVEGWKTCAFPSPTAPSGTIGAWRGSVRLDKEGDDDRDRANLCICSVTVFMKSCC